jgi:hypothetical protein
MNSKIYISDGYAKIPISTFEKLREIEDQYLAICDNKVVVKREYGHKPIHVVSNEKEALAKVKELLSDYEQYLDNLRDEYVGYVHKHQGNLKELREKSDKLRTVVPNWVRKLFKLGKKIENILGH